MKPQSKKITLHVSHLENALALYLKPYFPEAVEIGGVDINIPVSNQDGRFDLTIYLSPKDKKEVDVKEISVESEPTDSGNLPDLGL
jgi:hypothetical protein